MNKDIRQWARNCLSCQCSKVTRHNVSLLATFDAPNARFHHVHIDIVGPLLSSQGYTYLLIRINRFTRLPEAIPLTNIIAESVARAFIDRWVAQFGCPSRVTTNRGQQFESSFFNRLVELLGCKGIRTTAYHPASNGLVERFHRQLKASLCSSASTSWTESLTLVLLGLRTAVKTGIDCSAADLVYETTLRLPAEFVVPTPGPVSPSIDYAGRLREHMFSLSRVLTRQQHKPAYLNRRLNTCTYVFLRCDALRKPLQAPHIGPFKIISRADKHFVIGRLGKKDIVSIDCLKLAYVDNDFKSKSIPDNSAHTISKSTPARTDSIISVPSTNACPNPQPQLGVSD